MTQVSVTKRGNTVVLLGTRRGGGMDALASVRAAIRGSEITLTVSLAAAFLVYRFSRPA
jgi:hypothetical protein